MTSTLEKIKKEKHKQEWVGDVAAALGIMAMIPVAWYVTKTGFVRDINIYWMILRLASCILWVYFGCVNNITPNIISGSIVGIIVFYLIIMKILLDGKN